METVLFQMCAVMAIGLLWNHGEWGGIEAGLARRALSTAVFYILLPTLILKLLGSAPLRWGVFKISLFGIAMVASGAVAISLWLRFQKPPAPRAGAMWLAVVFPNVTFLGLPLLKEVYGDWAARLAIQLDLFACTPLVLTLGIATARHFGREEGIDSKRLWIRVPPLWAALLAITVNLLQLRWPPFLIQLFDLLSCAVTPLMLLSLGLALSFRTFSRSSLPLLLPVIFFKLFWMPAVALFMAELLGFRGEVKTALVLEAAMPSMLFGLVLSDRFGLDSRLYAALVTVTTLLSLVTLPFWQRAVQAAIVEKWLNKWGLPWAF